MRRLAGVLTAGLIALAPSVGAAFENDFELSKLGTPDALRVGTTIIPQDANAQERFARFVTQFALAVTPTAAGINASTGDAGFELFFTGDVALFDNNPVINGQAQADVGGLWPTEAKASGTLFLPTLHLRKGLPFSFEVGGDFQYITFSRMVATTGSLKWSLFEGFQWWPDVSIKAFVTGVLGTGPLNIITGGWDVGTSYRFPIAGGVEAALYGGYQRIGMNASTNNIDFVLTAEDETQPTADDSVFAEMPFGSDILNPTTGFQRVYFGAQVRYGILVVAFDGASAWGDNAIEAGSSTRFDTSLLKLGGRIGVAF